MKRLMHSRSLAECARLFLHGGETARLPAGLDFSASVNPLGPPVSVLEAIRKNLNVIARYPDPECARLTNTLAEHHQTPCEQIMVGNGSSELIDLVARVIRPRRVATVEPTYTEYLRASLLAGAEVDHWLPSAADVKPLAQPCPFDPSPANLVWVANPNNPTGFLWSRESLARWIGTWQGTIFVVDEAFLSFRADESAISLVPATREMPNLIVLRSLTKFLGIPGLRLGYAVGPAHLMNQLRQQRVPWSVNALAQVAGEVGIEDRAFAQQTQAWCESERAWLHGELSKLSDWLQSFESSGNFILVRTRGKVSAAQLAARLLEAGIRIRVADNFIGLDERCFRVAVRRREDNERLVAELRRCLQG